MLLKSNKILAVLLCVVAVSLGCSRSDKSADEQPVKVGTILGVTGQNADYGKKMMSGFTLAVEEANAAGGVNGRSIELKVEDSQFDPNKAVSGYRKLYSADGIGIIVGVTGSKNALPVCEAARDDDVIIIDALGSAPKLTTHGGPNYWRVMASDALAGRYNVRWAADDGLKRPAIVYVEDDWGTSYRDAVTAELGSRGFDEIVSLSIESGKRSFRAQADRIVAKDADAVFLLVYAKEGAPLMQQLREAGFAGHIYGSDNISAAEFVAAGPEVVEGVRVAMPAPAANARYDRFQSAFEARFGGRTPDANSSKSYDAMTLVIAAMREVGTEPAALRNLLSSPDFSFPGVTGTIQFDENGDLLSQEYRRMEYRGGELVEIDGG